MQLFEKKKARRFKEKSIYQKFNIVKSIELII